jgi:hypothetical protein
MLDIEALRGVVVAGVGEYISLFRDIEICECPARSSSRLRQTAAAVSRVPLDPDQLTTSGRPPDFLPFSYA